jgi:hypothetical protein
VKHILSKLAHRKCRAIWWSRVGSFLVQNNTTSPLPIPLIYLKVTCTGFTSSSIKFVDWACSSKMAVKFLPAISRITSSDIRNFWKRLEPDHSKNPRQRPLLLPFISVSPPLPPLDRLICPAQWTCPKSPSRMPAPLLVLDDTAECTRDVKVKFTMSKHMGRNRKYISMSSTMCISLHLIRWVTKMITSI